MATAISWLAKLEQAEAEFCLRANRGCRHPGIHALFVIVSRLGDGMFWYGLMLALPLRYGSAGLQASLQLAAAGIAGLAVYRLLKERLVRERPCQLHFRILAGARALDRYSFPSGHTLHAVSFTLIAAASFPALLWLLAPFTLLVAMSRVVLGLHYPSDVLAGALLGLGLAEVVLRIAA